MQIPHQAVPLLKRLSISGSAQSNYKQQLDATLWVKEEDKARGWGFNN